MRNPVAEFERLAERVAPQVEVAVLGAELLAAVAHVLNRERRRLSLVEHLDS